MNPDADVAVVRDDVVLVRVVDSSSFFMRLRGLLGRAPLTESDGMLIRPCNHIHTFGMRYTIDVLFMAKNGQVLKSGTIRPMRAFYCKHALSALELSEGAIERLGIHTGDCLSVVSSPAAENRRVETEIVAV